MAEPDLKALLERFDARLERFDARLERFDAHLSRNDELMERNARAWGKTVAALDAIRASIEDMSDEIRANTQATLHILDHFEGGGSSR